MILIKKSKFRKRDKLIGFFVGKVMQASQGKANPGNVVTLKAKTVCEGQFRMQTYVRNLEPMLIDEPPHLLGEDNAPNPSEALPATLGACRAVGVHAPATAPGHTLGQLALERAQRGSTNHPGAGGNDS